MEKYTQTLLGLLLLSTTTFAQKNINLQNESYSIDISLKSIKVSRVGQSSSEKLIPELTVFYSEKKPEYKRHRTENGLSPVASWNAEPDLWKSASFDVVKAKTMERTAENKVVFLMEEPENSSLSLEIELPETDGVPIIRWELRPKIEGWFSCGFTGLKTQKVDKLDFLYQPLVWTWKRFPNQAFLTPEAYASTGASFVNASDLTQGLHVHPEEVPFRYALLDDSRFGIALRTQNGMAKPMIFAPILGGTESKMQVGDGYQFSVQYFMQEGNWERGADYLYNEVIEYKRERQNATVSLNNTLQNMVDFAMDDEYSGWVKEWKGSDYLQDVPGTVKNVSALHPLSVSLTMGSQEIYRKRALPMMEYMMSRQKYLFGVDTTIKYQSPSMYLKGPNAEIGELSGLYQMTNFQNDAFLAEIERLFGKPRMLNLTTQTKSDSWQDYLARYKISRNDSLLTKAKQLADEYIENYVLDYPEDFTSSPGLQDRKAYFVTDFGIRWFDLVELYEATQDRKYLNAAEMGAMEMLLWTRSLPFAHPDSIHTFNKGGKVEMLSAKNHIEKSGLESPQEIDNFKSATLLSEQKVPAWRASFVGLLPESSYTYFLGSIMLTHHAPWMLRLAQLTDNHLLAEAAYNAVLGRYANYPGYYFNSYETNIYQLPDYPMKRFKDVRYNNIFYNHLWPHIALLQDFLVSDAYYRSGGEVDFPSVYAPGYAFLTSKVYGHDAGRVYDNHNVKLWLPDDALFTSEITLNHLWGYDENNTYLVLMNTSGEAVNTDLFLNPDVIAWNSGITYEVQYYQQNGDKSTGTLSNGKLIAQVPANGIQTIKLVDLKSMVPFQINDKEIASSPSSDNCSYFREEHEAKALGTLTGMRLKLSDFDNVYVYTDATPVEAQKVRLEYQVEGYDWESAEDTIYPYEFSIPIYAKEAKVKVKWKAENKQGEVNESKVFTLCY
mgnify:CR=1 FL=1